MDLGQAVVVDGKVVDGKAAAVAADSGHADV